MTYHLKNIPTTYQLREADRYTIKNEPIASIDLMERASLAFVNAIESKLLKKQRITIVCGIGNNGGDGFSVARILQSRGYDVTPILIKYNEHISPDCAINLNQLSSVIIANSVKDIPDFSAYDVIIDAIFGSGLTRSIQGLAADVIVKINDSNKPVYSIDIPSGLFGDQLSSGEHIVQSDLTICFQRPKLSFFFPENSKYIKEWTVVDIGLNENYIQEQKTPYFILNSKISKRVQRRKKFAHKGTYGHAMIVAGSYGKIGAAVLASKACLRSGTGLLTTYLPKCGNTIMQTAVPEAMCLTDKHSTFITTLPDLSIYDAIGIGPGIGKESLTKKVLHHLFQTLTHQKIVIDADAINILAEDDGLLKLLPEESILTPHPKEFERLVGKSKNSYDRLKKQIKFSKKYKCILVLKGANTSISSSTGKLYFNTSGNPGMATGGSGDVLTGIITGLLAQGYDTLEATLIGVYFHGKSGDDAIKTKGMNALIASDIIAFLRIERSKHEELS